MATTIDQHMPVKPVLKHPYVVFTIDGRRRAPLEIEGLTPDDISRDYTVMRRLRDELMAAKLDEKQAGKPVDPHNRTITTSYSKTFVTVLAGRTEATLYLPAGTMYARWFVS